ncbi:carbohydrate-binding protein [Pontiellaceae bacterium B12219]|nr:carbohydrate-binding protein [Pontiellaceae bacterium B12219]
MNRLVKRTLKLLLIMLLGAGSASALFFENDLTDAASVAMDFKEYRSSHNNSVWSYTNDYALAQDGTANTVLQGGAVLDFVTADDDTARSYLGTVYSNWMDHSWTAHIAVETVNVDPKNYLFFGLGDPTPKESYYNEPQNGQSIFLYWQSGSSGSKISVKLNGATVENTGVWQGDPGYDLYMTYNHTNKTVKFDVDNWNGGRGLGSDLDVSTTEISVEGLLTDTNKMHIFFGANAKVTFRDFDVVEAGVAVEDPSSTSDGRWLTVEAEAYTSQSGTQLETCSDTGGGQNLAYISDGDWCLYEDIALGAGQSLLKLRTAREDGGDTGKIEVRLDSTTGILLGEVDVPETGGWQNWETLYLPVSVTNPTNDVVLVFTETGTTNGGSLFNLNWWSRSPLVEAENFDAGAGYRFETTADIGGGQNLGWIDAGEWMEYTINVETTGLHQIDFRVASDGGSDGIEIVSDGNTIGTMAVADTGDYQVWETQSVFVNFSETGEQTLRLEFLGGGFNLNWFSYASLSLDDATELTVGTARKQMMRLGLDYERLWYWYGDGLDPVPEWSVNDCNVDYLRTAVVAKYELEEATDPSGYNLSAYTSKVIPMMTAMQQANPNIKWFASPRPLNESYPNKKWEGSNVTWQPYPIWVTGATTPISGDYAFDPIKCAQYLIRYLRLMKHYGFKISYLDLTNEWQENDNSSGNPPGRINQAAARDLVEYMKAYIAIPPDPASDPTDPTGFYAANYPQLEADDMPLTIGASSWNYLQGTSWIHNLDTQRRRDAIDIASSHNTDRSGTAQAFVDEVHATLGADTEVWETEQHGWKSTSGENEVTSFYYYIQSIRAGFTGLNGWLAIGTSGQGHSYLINNGSTVTRNVKYYIFKKLSTTSNYGYALDMDELSTDSTMALVRDNLLTVWVNNTSTASELVEIDFSGHVRDGSPITYTRWSESLAVEGIEGTPISSDSSSFLASIDGESLYCFEIPLVDNEDNFPFVQAETYDAGSGVSVLGDGVAFATAGSEIEFDLDVTKTGGFGVGFRVSSASAHIRFDIYEGSTLMGSVDQAPTGDAQTWTTVYTTLQLDGGPMNLKIVATGGGWNLDSIEFESGDAPAAPTGLYSTLGTLMVALDWEAVDGVDTYEVKRSTVKGSGYVTIASTSGLTYTDTTVEAGQTYYYVISVSNRYGSNESAVATGYGLAYDMIGPDSSYAESNPELEKDNLFDKDVNTFYDTTANNSWAGLDFGAGNEQQITQVDYVLRDWSLSYERATNATFEAANSADFSDAVVLFTVTPAVQTFPAVNSETIADPNGYRYVRLKAAPGRPLYTFAELDISSVAASTTNGTSMAWLKQYGLSPVDDELDNDHDGLLTWEEYIAGLNPTNPDAFLLSGTMSDAAKSLSWDAVSGRVYNIYWASNLVDGFSLVESNALNGFYIDSAHADDEAGFYKITVELEP